MKLPSSTVAGILITLGTAAFFGVYPATARFAYADGANASFMILATTFMRMAGLCLFCLVTRKALFKTRAHTRQGAIGGIFQALSVICVFLSLNYVPGPVMIIIVFTHTLMLLFYLVWKGERQFDRMTLATTLLALAGLSLVLDLWQLEGGYSVFGMALAFIAALATGTRVYIYGREMQTRNPAVVGAENFVFALLFILPMLAVMPVQIPASSAGWTLALLGSLASAAATIGMFYGIALLGSFRFSLFLKLEPVFTVFFSLLILSEALEWRQYAGIAVVLASLVFYQYAENRRKPVIAVAVQEP